MEITIVGKKISSKRINKLWTKNFSSKPIPKIYAYNVSKDELLRLKRIWDERLGESIRELEIKEYGTIVNPDLTMAFVTYITDESKGNIWLIIRRIDSIFSEKHDLLHELKHIFDEDILDTSYVKLDRKL